MRGSPAAATVAQRHLRHRAAHRERPRARHAPDRPHLEPVAAADPHGRAEPPAARRARLRGSPASGASPSSSCTGCQRVQPLAVRIAELEPPRALPVDADELERARACSRRASDRSPWSGSSRTCSVASPADAEAGQREREHGERRGDDGPSWGETSVTQHAFSGKPRGPSLTECLRGAGGPRMRAVATVESTWTRASCERSDLSSRRAPPRSSSRCPPRAPTHRACSSSSSTTTSTRSRRTTSRTRCTAPSGTGSRRS